MGRKVSRLSKRIMSLMLGALVLAALDGCSGVVVGAQANYHAVVAQATASAAGKVYQAQDAATPVPNNLAMQATQIKQEYEFAGKQAEDQSFTTILVGMVLLFTIAGLTTIGVRLYARRLKYKTALEEQFVFSAEKQTNRRF